MVGNSSPVHSSQEHVAEALGPRLARQRRQPWRFRPCERARIAFERVQPELQLAEGNWLLDAGCGTGASTRRLAAEGRCILSVGVDKSLCRLKRGGANDEGWLQGQGWLLLREDLRAFWWLLAQSGLRARRQYLLYPNPWPKPRHLRRRWHGQPVLPLLLRAAHELELRSNWRVYLDEFAAAAASYGIAARIERVPPGPPMSPFELKYRTSGHALWRLLLDQIPELAGWGSSDLLMNTFSAG